MMVQVLKSRGVEKVILVGTRDYRLERGAELGADHVINISDSTSNHYTDNLSQVIRELNSDELADRAILATSALNAIHSALEITGRHSTIVLFGLPGDNDIMNVPILETILMDKSIRFSWLAPNTWEEAIQLISRGAVNMDRIISHTYHLDDLIDGISKVQGREDNCTKGIIQVP